jgi:hypothetical protein
MKPTRGYSSPGCHSTFATTPARSTPALRPVAEACVEASDVVRGPTHRPRKERRDRPLEHLIGGLANRVLEALGLQGADEAVDGRVD